MTDSEEKTTEAISTADRNQLLGRIVELETLLDRKKTQMKREQTAAKVEMPRLKVGTDGIPVLTDTVSKESLQDDGSNINDEDLVNEIIARIDKEVSQDLDDLVIMLKDSIIDDVKARLLSELKHEKDR